MMCHYTTAVSWYNIKCENESDKNVPLNGWLDPENVIIFFNFIFLNGIGFPFDNYLISPPWWNKILDWGPPLKTMSYTQAESDLY